MSGRFGWRLVAWACLVALMLAATVPGGATLAILALAGPFVADATVFSLLPAASGVPAPDRLEPRGVPARAPPLA